MLERADLLAEGLAVAAVLQRLGEDPLGARQPAEGDDQPLLRQVREEVAQAAALLAQQVRRRHPDVGEEQLRGVLRVQPDLVEVAAPLEARHAALDDEQADSPGSRRGIGLGRHDHEIREDPVADEGLRPVEDVVLAVADGGGRHALQVTARPRLGHRDRGDELPGAEPGQPPPLLLRRAQRRQVRPDDVVVQADRHAGEAAERLDEDGVVPEVRVAAAAVLLRARTGPAGPRGRPRATRPGRRSRPPPTARSAARPPWRRTPRRNRRTRGGTRRRVGAASGLLTTNTRRTNTRGANLQADWADSVPTLRSALPR